MQTLFAKYFPLEPLPTDFATRLKERVLLEVALAMKPAHKEMQAWPRWVRALHPKFLWAFVYRLVMFLLVGTLLLRLGNFFCDAFLDTDQDYHDT